MAELVSVESVEKMLRDNAIGSPRGLSLESAVAALDALPRVEERPRRVITNADTTFHPERDIPRAEASPIGSTHEEAVARRMKNPEYRAEYERLRAEEDKDAPSPASCPDCKGTGTQCPLGDDCTDCGAPACSQCGGSGYAQRGVDIVYCRCRIEGGTKEREERQARIGAAEELPPWDSAGDLERHDDEPWGWNYEAWERHDAEFHPSAEKTEASPPAQGQAKAEAALVEKERTASAAVTNLHAAEAKVRRLEVELHETRAELSLALKRARGAATRETGSDEVCGDDNDPDGRVCRRRAGHSGGHSTQPDPEEKTGPSGTERAA